MKVRKCVANTMVTKGHRRLPIWALHIHFPSYKSVRDRWIYGWKKSQKIGNRISIGQTTVTKIVNKLRQERLVELSVDRFAELTHRALADV